MVLSGKGGVGESTIAANLAVSLSLANKRVGLLDIQFLGRIPIDPQIVQACDAGQPYVGENNRNETAKAFSNVTQRVLMLENQCKTKEVNSNKKGARNMRIAIPVVEGKLRELKNHAPFTLFGASTGLVISYTR